CTFAELIEVARNIEAAQKKWLHAELKLKKQKELLVKSDVARAALEVKLKHARNQLDMEIKKRYKAEADYQCLEWQMQLICDVLVHDSKSSACLNDEQRSMLTSFSHKGASVPQLSGIDESSFLSHSDISYDRTDDDLVEIRFGKLAIKCRDCRVVSHPECTCTSLCKDETLESFAPSTRSRIPSLIVQCVHEIERRGLEEKGIYRVPGGEQLVKELREKYVSGKGPLMLHKVEEVHAVCGLLKDFLRKLTEPLITFKLHRTFMEASEMADEDKSIETLIKTIKELPQPNKDTLAFLMLHLQRVMQMFGPTVIGHGMLEPSPMTIMRDTNTQPKVSCKKISFISVSECVGTDKIFKPLTSPELSKYNKTTSSGSINNKS
uniref:Si:ch1073-416j23.1 n=1 Tax=Sinocyclocheilus rhinocerous TaxID=307959 RepID=A0A673GNY8_9TELE